jgi:hypothetical protein
MQFRKGFICKDLRRLVIGFCLFFYALFPPALLAGSIFGWGNNSYGQATPPAGNNFIAIAAGLYHSLALRRNRYALAGDLNND